MHLSAWAWNYLRGAFDEYAPCHAKACIYLASYYTGRPHRLFRSPLFRKGERFLQSQRTNFQLSCGTETDRQLTYISIKTETSFMRLNI